MVIEPVFTTSTRVVNRYAYETFRVLREISILSIKSWGLGGCLGFLIGDLKDGVIFEIIDHIVG